MATCRYFVFLSLMILILFLFSCSSGGSTGNPTGDSDAAESADQSENEMFPESEEEISQGLLTASQSISISDNFFVRERLRENMA